MQKLFDLKNNKVLIEALNNLIVLIGSFRNTTYILSSSQKKNFLAPAPHPRTGEGTASTNTPFKGDVVSPLCLAGR